MVDPKNQRRYSQGKRTMFFLLISSSSPIASSSRFRCCLSGTIVASLLSRSLRNFVFIDLNLWPRNFPSTHTSTANGVDACCTVTATCKRRTSPCGSFGLESHVHRTIWYSPAVFWASLSPRNDHLCVRFRSFV